MGKTATTRYDVTEHLRTPEEMAAYLEACLEDANGDAACFAPPRLLRRPAAENNVGQAGAEPRLDQAAHRHKRVTRG